MKKKIHELVTIFLTAFVLVISGSVALTVSAGDFTLEIEALDQTATNKFNIPDAYIEKMNEMRIVTNEMHDYNEDLIGYMWIDGIIDQPVAWNNGKGRLHYINKDEKGEHEYHGIPFLEDEAKGSFRSNSMIYGHNTIRDALFSRLDYYNDPNVFKNSPPLIIYDVLRDEFKIMDLYTKFEVMDGRESVRLDSFDNDIERAEYNQSLHERSDHEMKDGKVPEIDSNTDVMFLQTCSTIHYRRYERTVFGFYETNLIDGLELARSVH